MALPYQPGDTLLCKTPLGVWLATFVENDEGWAKMQFSDESVATMRPSHVNALDVLALELAIDEYEAAIFSGCVMQIDRMCWIVEEVAKAIGYENRNRLAALHSIAEQAAFA